MRSIWKYLPSSGALWISFSLPCVGNVNLGECISGIYTWSLAIVGIAAFLSIIYGAWGVVTAFGNTGKLGEATKRISNAVLGIVLLFSSYLILRTINPALVGGGVNLPKINKVDTIKNTGGENDLTKISFDVTPTTADLSDDTLLSFKLSIFGSKEGIDTLCGADKLLVFYRVYYIDNSTNPTTKLLVRIFSWSRDLFGTGGKELDRSFDEKLKTGWGGVTLPIKIGQAAYQAEFGCSSNNKVINTSSLVPVTVVP